MIIKSNYDDIPESMNEKAMLLKEAIWKIERFENDNPQISKPVLMFDALTSELHRYVSETKTIKIYLASSSVRARRPNQWSVPGSITDRTAHGATLYYYGIHLFTFLKSESPELFNKWKAFRWELRDLGRPITSASGLSAMDSFADTVRLFISNPLLLKAGMPERYHFFTEVLGLSTSNDTEWQSYFDDLRDARFLRYNEKWVAENQQARNNLSTNLRKEA